MNLSGTPTSAFYGIVFVLAFTLVAVAAGKHPLKVFIVGVPVAYALLISSMGGFASLAAFEMAFGFGLLIMIPTCIGVFMAIVIGALLNGIRTRKRPTPNE